MKLKTIILAAFLAITANAAQIESGGNWNGYLDTIQMPRCSSTVLIYGSTVFNLTDYDMIRLVCQSKDTVTAGFATDSLSFAWGYQTFSLCLDTAGVVDTCYNPPVVVDTMTVDSFGKAVIYPLNSSAIATSPSRRVDTTSCRGWATQSRTFAPEWDVYCRLWVQGLAKNRKGSGAIKTQFTVIRRLYSGSRGQ